jgi:hypothetical protein
VSATDTKEVKIGSVVYRISQFSARDGSWVVGQFITRMLLLDPEKASDEKNLAFILTTLLPSLSEETFNSIRDKCFAVCSQKDDIGGYTPLLMRDGSNRWAVKEPPDLLATNVLLTSALAFNLSPFFAPGALETLRQIYPDLSQLSVTLTDISSAPSQQVTGATAK